MGTLVDGGMTLPKQIVVFTIARAALPTDGANCRVHVFQTGLDPMDRWDLGQANLLQWICREWVQELGFNETTVDVEGGDDRVGIKNPGMDGLTVWGNKLLARWYELPSSLIHQRHEGGTCVSPPPLREPVILWEISYLIWFASVHPDPTLVSHHCPHLSAHLISRSFWRSVSCCDPDNTV